MSKAPSFFICERIPSENRGEAAILEGLVEGLRRVFGTYSISIYSMRLDEDTAYYGKYGNVVGLKDAAAFSSKLSRAVLSLQLLISALATYVGVKLHFSGTLYKPFADADVILQGHDNVYRHEIKPKDALIAFWAKRHKKLLVIPGGSVGPFEFKSALHRKLSMYVLNNADLITLRDPQSGDFLKKIGVKNEYAVLNDLAFLLQPEPLDALPWPRDGKKVVGFTPTNYVFQNARTQDGHAITKGDFLLEMHRYLCWLTKEQGCHVVLIPHVYGPERKQDDRLLIHEITKDSGLAADDMTVLDKELYTAGQFKYLIGQLDMLVACRTHTLIAALGRGTPVLAFTDPGRYKTNGILGNLFQLPEYMFDVTAWSQEGARALTTELLADLSGVKEKILSRQPEAVRLAEENIRMISNKLTWHK